MRMYMEKPQPTRLHFLSNLGAPGPNLRTWETINNTVAIRETVRLDK